MEHVQQRRKLTTTLSPQTYKKLEEIKEKAGFTSINQAIDFVVLNDSIKKQLTMIFDAITELNTYVTRTADREFKESGVTVQRFPGDIPGVFKGSDLKIIKDEDI